MRKRIGSSPLNDGLFVVDAPTPHRMLEPPRMIAPGQPAMASTKPMEGLA